MKLQESCGLVLGLLLGVGLIGGADKPRPVIERDARHAAVPAPAISGHVREQPDGNGAEGATVQLWSHQDGKKSTAGTDRDGKYRFALVEPGMYTLRIIERTAGEWSEGIVVRVGNDPVQAGDLFLRLPQSVSGTVTDVETGEPVAGTWIRFSTAERNWNAVETDKKGRYRIYVPPREVQIESTGTRDRYYAVREGERYRRIVVQKNKPVQNVDIRLRSAAKFTGKVFLPSGEPAKRADVLVEAWWSPKGGTKDLGRQVAQPDRLRGMVPLDDGTGSSLWSMATGRDMRLKTNDRGEYVCYLRDAYETAERGVAIKKVVAWMPDRSLGGVADADSVSVRLSPPGSIEFKLLDARGQPVDDARITTSDVQPNWRTFLGGPVDKLGNGKYRVRGLIAGLEYYLSIEGVPTSFSLLKFTVRSGERLDKGTLRAPPKRTLPDILKSLDSADHYQRERACLELGELGPAAAEAVPKLIDAGVGHRVGFVDHLPRRCHRCRGARMANGYLHGHHWDSRWPNGGWSRQDPLSARPHCLLPGGNRVSPVSIATHVNWTAPHCCPTQARSASEGTRCGKSLAGASG